MEASSPNSKFSAPSKREFPSPIELEVASALLILSAFSTTPPPRETEDESDRKKKKFELKMGKEEEEEEEDGSMKVTGSASWLSSPASSTVTAEISSDQRAQFVNLLSNIPQMMKLKVVRKKRSKNLTISGKQEGSYSGSITSCVSTGSTRSSEVSSHSRQHRRSYMLCTPVPKKKPVLSSSHLRGLGESILNILSTHGRASEVMIREVLGDSPSTSKALRILLNLEKVKRSGAGGRADPYVYMIA